MIHTEDAMAVGETYSVFLEYDGPLKDDLKGIYWSSYQDGQSIK